MHVDIMDTLVTANATETITKTSPMDAAYGFHTIVVGGTFAAGNIVALSVNDGVNDRYLGHADAPCRISFTGRMASCTATLVDVTNGSTGIAAGTSVTVRIENHGPTISSERSGRIIRAIRTAEAGTVVLLDIAPATPSHVNMLPDGVYHNGSEHTFQLDGAIGGGVALEVAIRDMAGVETVLANVTNAMLPWQSGIIAGDLAQVAVTLPALFTTAGLILYTCHTTEEA